MVDKLGGVLLAPRNLKWTYDVATIRQYANAYTIGEVNLYSSKQECERRNFNDDGGMLSGYR
jgi:hypothetical protein